LKIICLSVKRQEKKGGFGMLLRKESSVIAFLIVFLILCSCAKKQIKPPETAVTAPAVEKKAPGVSVEKPEVRLEELKGEEKRIVEEIRQFEAEMIHFDFDSAELKPEAKEILKKKAEWLLKHPEFSVRIEGHCDERGTEEYNLALGQRRADAAARYLIQLGVSPDRICTISYGEERPIDPRHCEEAWAKNRRAEFKLLKKPKCE